MPTILSDWYRLGRSSTPPHYISLKTIYQHLIQRRCVYHLHSSFLDFLRQQLTEQGFSVGEFYTELVTN